MDFGELSHVLLQGAALLLVGGQIFKQKMTN